MGSATVTQSVPALLWNVLRARQGGAVTASSLSVSELKWAACSGLLLQIQCRCAYAMWGGFGGPSSSSQCDCAAPARTAVSCTLAGGTHAWESCVRRDSEW